MLNFKSVSFLAALAVTSLSQAGLGDQIYSLGGTVTATIVAEQGTPGYTNILSIVSPVAYTLGTNTQYGNTTSFSAAAGTEIVLSIESPEGLFFTGPASGNPDNTIHANVVDLGSGSVRVDFEDLLNGGDFNYGDGSVLLEGVYAEPVPEPASMAAIALGLAAVARKRRQA